MKSRKTVKINRLPDSELITELIEYMVYYKLSYPTGNKDTCEVQLNDAACEINTPNITYKLGQELYIQLYLLSNKAIANIYKIIKDDQTL